MLKRNCCIIVCLMLCSISVTAQDSQKKRLVTPFVTDTLMAHDPVLAYEDGTYYLFATGMGIMRATSTDRKTWTVYKQGVLEQIPAWTHDSVPGFKRHIWAPDIIRWHDKWWLTYSCSTFGKNGSAIGLITNKTLNPNSPDYRWADGGAVVVSREKRDNWNAIDPNIVIDDKDQPWIVWGSFWDGIQLAQLTVDESCSNYGAPSLRANKSKTIARRYPKGYKKAAPNPTSKFAGKNAIEAPFILKRNGWYYLFVSWDYCCRGSKSNYRVAVGRSKKVSGPYKDRSGKNMRKGGGTLFVEGDHQSFEAMGHCAAYQMNGKDIFICHGYSVEMEGAALLVQKEISWTEDGWPVAKD